MFGKNTIYKIDFLLVAAVILVVFLGILTIYSAGFDPIDKVNSGLYKKQLVWFIIGFMLMLVFTFVNYKYLGDYSLYIYGFFLLVLIITTVFGSPIRNTRAWISFGFFSIQPSEFMKLSLVLILGKYIEFRERDIRNLRELFIPAILTMVPMLIIFIQPDFGTAVLFIPILFTMLFVGGADVTHLASIIGIAGIATVVPMVLTYREWIGASGSNFLLNFFKDTDMLFIVSGILILAALVTFILNFFIPNKLFRKIYIPSTVLSFGLFFSVLLQKYLKVYQKRRILVFLNPDLDPHGSGYNVIQSKIAVGSGEFFGKGFLNGSQSQLGFLPEKTSDFVFSVFAEEWGFFGSVILLALMGVIIFRGIQIAFESKDKFGALLASGIVAIFFFHLLINIGMVLGIMPVTGLPLPLMSYGGSNLAMSMIAVGILINIRMRKFVY
ncbi:MAG TPA: rod shape-determining protein RodA [Spirochaetota bacterium]|nr:rod shape-determining protein RodA [Spirochaetota bacterium]HPJ38067.1 rod shape-determining protein RodA [Spirochaetota bacterium]HPQ51956.1 rod shape-determining protein RodA [Spirochaetota bacterium]